MNPILIADWDFSWNDASQLENVPLWPNRVDAMLSDFEQSQCFTFTHIYQPDDWRSTTYSNFVCDVALQNQSEKAQAQYKRSYMYSPA